MNFLVYIRSLTANFFHCSQAEHEMEEVLRSHIQHRAYDPECSGVNRSGGRALRAH